MILQVVTDDCVSYVGCCRFAVGGYRLHLGLCTLRVVGFIWVWLCCTEVPMSGVKPEEIRKGRILAGLKDIWRVCLEILPLQKSR